MTDSLEDRAQKIFGKLQNIQTSVEGEKQQKFRLILDYLYNIEQSIEEQANQKNLKFTELVERLQRLKIALDQENAQRDLLDDKFKREMYNLQKNCKNMLNSFSRERVESEKKVFHSLSQQVDLLSSDIANEISHQNETQQNLQTLQEGFQGQKLLSLEYIPAFYQELEREIHLREEIEERIAQQFNEQLDELKQMFDNQQRLREQREEEIIGILKQIYQKAYDQCKYNKQEREKNEELLVKLVEQVVEKIKIQLLDSEF